MSKREERLDAELVICYFRLDEERKISCFSQEWSTKEPSASTLAYPLYILRTQDADHKAVTWAIFPFSWPFEPEEIGVFV